LVCVAAALCVTVDAGSALAVEKKGKPGGQITWLLSSDAPTFDTRNGHAAKTYGPEIMAVHGELVRRPARPPRADAGDGPERPEPEGAVGPRPGQGHLVPQDVAVLRRLAEGQDNNLAQAQKPIDQYAAEKGPVKGPLQFGQSLSLLGTTATVTGLKS
jgi:hypothetical protein